MTFLICIVDKINFDAAPEKKFFNKISFNTALFGKDLAPLMFIYAVILLDNHFLHRTSSRPGESANDR